MLALNIITAVKIRKFLIYIHSLGLIVLKNYFKLLYSIINNIKMFLNISWLLILF
jgi:hypothetical protein